MINKLSPDTYRLAFTPQTKPPKQLNKQKDLTSPKKKVYSIGAVIDKKA